MAKPKVTDAQQVADYMQALQHPLKPEIEAVRAIIKGAGSQIKERIKWNAPSYYHTHDFVTFNLRSPEQVHLVFHYAPVVHIVSSLLQGDYKDRRMVYFRNMAEVENRKAELQFIVRQLLQHMDNQTTNN